jgi:CDP-diglyceride synthetase
VPEVTRWLDALLLVIAANVTPWAAGRYLSGHWRTPLDGGAILADGTRVLGDHKTWRGLTVGVLACGVVARLLQLPLFLGIAFGALSLAADIVSSFVKRRLRLQPGAEIPGVDQLPEALVPLLVLSRPLGLGLIESIAIALVFLVLDLAATRLRHPRERTGR